MDEDYDESQLPYTSQEMLAKAAKFAMQANMVMPDECKALREAMASLEPYFMHGFYDRMKAIERKHGLTPIRRETIAGEPYLHVGDKIFSVTYSGDD